MKFATPFDRIPQPAEAGGGRRLVETVGYVPAEKQIKNLLEAGKRLKDWRSNQFDFPNGKIDESFSDPTRAGNFDLADATILGMQTEQSIKIVQEKQLEAKKEAERIEAEEKAAYEAWKASQTAIEAP